MSEPVSVSLHGQVNRRVVPDLEERRVAALEKMAEAQLKRAELEERQLHLNESEHEDRKLMFQGMQQLLQGVTGYIGAMTDTERALSARYEKQYAIAAHATPVEKEDG
jgi:hypothetical protein